MIVTAVVCPPAPLLIPGLADRLAAGVPDLRAACLRALSHLEGADQVVILSVARPGQEPSLLMPGDVVPPAGLARSDLAVTASLRLPSGPATTALRGVAVAQDSPGGRDLAAVGTVVGAHLLAIAGIAAPTSAVQITRGAGTQLVDEARTGLLVMADGAACHGEHAPGGPDPRSEEFDRDIVTALRSGDPSTLAAICHRLSDLAPALRADSLPALAALADLTADNGTARAEVLHYSAPFGVGYPVAVWQWG